MAIQSIHNSSTVTSSGSSVFRCDGALEVVLVYDLAGAVSGVSPTIQYSITEIDPANESTTVGSTENTAVLTTQGQVGSVTLLLQSSCTTLISWTVSGAGASFSGVNAVVYSREVGITASDSYNNYVPNPTSDLVGTAHLSTDLGGALITRGQAFTDEGSYRDGFIQPITSSFSGTVTLTSGSTLVVGSGALFLSTVTTNHFVKRSVDPDSMWTQISYVADDNNLELAANYPGSTGAGALYSLWLPSSGTNSSIIVNTGSLFLSNSAANGAYVAASRFIDYGPLNVAARVQAIRYTNQTPWFGLVSTLNTPSASLAGQKAIVTFDSTLATNQLTFRTANSNAASGQRATVVTLPPGLSVTGSNIYQIQITGQYVTLTLSGAIIAQHNSSIPDPYQPLYMTYQIENTAAVTSSAASLASDFVYANNTNRVEVANSFAGEPLFVQLVGKTSGGLPSILSGRAVPNYPSVQGTGLQSSSLAITLASLAQSGTRWSTAVDNTINQYEDALIFIQTTTATSGVSANGYVNVYGYGTIDGVNYPEVITGIDGSGSFAAPPNLPILSQITANAITRTFKAGPFSFCRMYGIDRLPPKWGLALVNLTGAALNATGTHSISWMGVNGQLA